jgi:hypothetical protein
MVYFMLFLYSIAPMIAYAYEPFLSERISAEFGLGIFFDAYWFTTLSMVAFWLAFHLIGQPILRSTTFATTRAIPRPALFIALNVIYLLALAALYWDLRNVLTYEIVSTDELIPDNQRDQFVGFMLLFKLAKFAVLVLAALLLEPLYDKGRGQKLLRWKLAVFIGLLLVFGYTAISIGSRTDLLACSLGIVALLYVSPWERHRPVARTVKLVIGVGVVGMVLYLVQVTRAPGGLADADTWIQVALQNDYLAPFHILYAAMYFEIISPEEVIVSNASNAAILVGHPLLQQYVMDYFVPGLATRTASYAFYIFTEGYLAAGWGGILYNALVPLSGCLIWRLFGCSESIKLNHLIIAVCVAQVATVVRSQSGFFIKDVYLYTLPVLMLYYFATGVRPRFRRSTRRRSPVVTSTGTAVRQV